MEHNGSKDIENYLDFKSGAVLVMNHNIETDVINTRGKAYGLEVSAPTGIAAAVSKSD